MSLTSKEEKSLALQHYVAWVNFFWFAPIYIFVLRFIARYRIRDLKAFRAKAKQFMQDAGTRPVILCSNHLTLIDSMLITWALSPFSDVLRNFHRVPWHMPEFANFAKNIWLRAMCYLGKSIYVKRGGGAKDRRKSIDQIHWLMRYNHVFCLFPEGGRSRSGRVEADSATYSVGEYVQHHPNARIVCMYIRGDSQESWGKWPKLGSTLEADIRELKIETIEEGRKGARDISRRIIEELIAMEKLYFEKRTHGSQERSADLHPLQV